MGDRFNSRGLLPEQAKVPGMMTADTTKFEWMTNQHRDTIASNVAHYDMLMYISMAESKSVGRVRYELLEKMLAPIGIKPKSGKES